MRYFRRPARRGRKQLDVFERNLTPSQKHEDFQQRPEFNRRWTRINADERSLGISYRRPSAFIGGFLPSLCATNRLILCMAQRFSGGKLI
jgi:hypothetical protein